MKTLVECDNNNATTQGTNDEVSQNHISENLTENGYTNK